MPDTAFCLPNLASHSVETLPFWEQKWPVPDVRTKAAFHKWRLDPATEHCCFSMVEGFDTRQRVTPDNPPLRLHGFVADYDARFSDDEFQEFVARTLEGEFPVSYAGRSFRGGIHAIWMFDQPVLLHSKKINQRFLARLARRIGCAELARGLDPKFSDTFLYYSVGGEWHKVSPYRIPAKLLHHIQYEASTSTDFRAATVSVPLPDVAEEVARRFPNRWEGPFVEGARGVRFWAEEADNPTAAVVRPEGMQCFTGDHPFVSWAEIFGPKFVEQYVEERVSEVIADYYYDGQSFWHAPPSQPVRALTRADMMLALKVEHELQPKPPKGESTSELERGLQAIVGQKRVDAAVPFVFRTDRIIARQGKVYLNTSGVRPMQMDNTPAEWGERFGPLAEWLEDFFGEEQLPYFIAWLSRFYRSAVDGEPQPGQAVFILGDADSGKTLLNTGLLSAMFGGHQRAADFLLHRANFNGHLFDAGLWALDDEVGEADKAKFSGRLKEFVANYDFLYAEKYRKGAGVEWKGRIVSTLNCDADSIRLLPDLEMSIVDKLMVFKVTKTPVEFTTAWVDSAFSQLPAFCRYLYDHKIPEELRGGERFGVRSYINEPIRHMTLIDSKYTNILELLDLFQQSYVFTDEEGGEWKGTTTAFYSLLSNMSQASALLRSTSPQAIARGFSNMVAKGHPSVRRAIGEGNVQKWIISPLSEKD